MTTTETSVALSLAELTQIEEARIERERQGRARERAERLHAEKAEHERLLAVQAAEAKAEADARARRATDEAAERARLDAREHVAAEVARIEADAKARLEADNAVRAHELAQLRVRRETGRRRRELVMGAALALVVALGGLGAWDAAGRASKHERTTQELLQREHSLVRERDDAKRSELQSLERRHATLLARSRAGDAKAAQQTADSARAAVDPRAPSHDRLRAFADALDVLEARIDLLDEVARLDRRGADLAAWAASKNHAKRLVAVNAAARAAKAETAGREAAIAYERALDNLSHELSEKSGGGSREASGEPVVGAGRTCQEGDPGCGLDGRPLF
ncbi:MAG: hypothetical protein L6Q84_26785 [Polyangiaceae bacterium]|nr:hypothetical protein [Polyangiaceae bacterium]